MTTLPFRRAAGAAPAGTTRREVAIHGQVVTFLEAGADSGGPVLVLLHGIASSSRTWESTLPLLAASAHVIAPDMLGHGGSAKPRSGDYSLGAYATGLRDLLVVLGIERATIVGHSFGGGVAMQFAHQFPERTERIALVSSGGLGQGVSLALRAATLPGATTVLGLGAAMTPPLLARLVHRVLAAVPALAGPDLAGAFDAFDSFHDSGARAAFTRTARGALDWTGQRLTGTEKLYLLAEVPVLLVGGTQDTVIPAAHTVAAHDALPASRLELFDGAGHFPHLDDPCRFAQLLTRFVGETRPAPCGPEALRRAMLAVASSAEAAGRPDPVPAAMQTSA